jgi:hypothetical protein
VNEGEGGSGQGYEICLRCGKLLQAGSSFCIACGADLKASPSTGQKGSTDIDSFQSSRQPGTLAPGPYPAPYPPASPGYYAPSPAVSKQSYTSYQGPWQYQPTAPDNQIPGPAVPQQVNMDRQDLWGFQPAAYTARKTEVMALASLLCAVASFALLPLIPAVAAIILGYAARDRIRRSKGTLEGEGLATAGIVIGVINVVLVLGLLTVIVVVSLYEAALLFPFI